MAVNTNRRRFIQLSGGAAAASILSPTIAKNLGLQFLEDLAHDWNTTHQAWNNGNYDQWIPAGGPTTMAYLQRSDIPFHYALADAFTVCAADEYFPGDSSYEPGPHGLGPRVPMLAVSPWNTGGRVNSEVFDHTSIIRVIEKRFGVREPNISNRRRTVSGDLTSAFDFSLRPPAATGLPSTTGYTPPDRDRHPDHLPTPPTGTRTPPAQEPGPPPARALPYDLAAHATVSTGTVSLEFANTGSAGAVFHVDSVTDATGPWDYTVSAGRRLSAALTVAAGSAYSYEVHAPNGSPRTLKGSAAAAGPEATARHTVIDGEGELLLSFENRGTDAVTISFTDADGNQGGRGRFRLPAGGPAEQTVHTTRTHGWYDLTATTNDDPAYQRRFAGHRGRPPEHERPGNRHRVIVL